MKKKTDYRNAFFDEFYSLASKDKNVVFLSADTDADSLIKFRNNFPKQFYNTGVTEQNSVTVAAGLALSGKKVFVYSMVPFITMRCFEQIKIDICSMKLPVCLIGLGTGLSFSHYGPAGHGVIDIAIMRTLSEMTILNPSDPLSASQCARIAYKNKIPTYVRLHKTQSENIYKNFSNFNNDFNLINKGDDAAIITTGLMTSTSIKVVNHFKKNNLKIALIDFLKLNPINKKYLIKELKKYRKVITVEDNIYTGGLGSLVSEVILDHGLNIKLKRIALKNEQCFDYGNLDWIYKKHNLDMNGIIKQIREFLKH